MPFFPEGKLLRDQHSEVPLAVTRYLHALWCLWWKRKLASYVSVVLL